MGNFRDTHMFKEIIVKKPVTVYNPKNYSIKMVIVFNLTPF